MKEPRVTAKPLLVEFKTLKEPRVARTRLHSLNEILVIAICGFVCGVEDWVDLEFFGNCKKEWFKTFLPLTNGIPSHEPTPRIRPETEMRLPWLDQLVPASTSATRSKPSPGVNGGGWGWGTGRPGVECVFRPKANTRSGRSRTVIPAHAEHPFRAKPNTDSGHAEHPESMRS